MPEHPIEPPFNSPDPIATSDDGVALTEAERIMVRDLIATFLIDETGTHRYDMVDAIWSHLYRRGFNIMRRRDIDIGGRDGWN